MPDPPDASMAKIRYTRPGVPINPNAPPPRDPITGAPLPTGVIETHPLRNAPLPSLTTAVRSPTQQLQSLGLRSTPSSPSTGGFGSAVPFATRLESAFISARDTSSERRSLVAKDAMVNQALHTPSGSQPTTAEGQTTETGRIVRTEITMGASSGPTTTSEPVTPRGGHEGVLSSPPPAAITPKVLQPLKPSLENKDKPLKAAVAKRKPSTDSLMSDSTPAIEDRHTPRSALNSNAASRTTTPPAFEGGATRRQSTTTTTATTPTGDTTTSSTQPSRSRRASTATLAAAARKAAPKPAATKKGTAKVPTRRLHKRQKSTVSVASDPEILPDAEAEEDQDEENDDDVDPNAVFCICRKPDDHTFMIGCEGPCQDWYHGHCVKINESQQERIDVYMCDKCHQAGHGATTYKPLCRRPTCERVAQVIQGLESKYCSRQCGRLFFQENLARTSEREKSGTGAFGPGARLNTQQLAALAKGTNNAKEFHMLGDDAMLLSPPPTVSPEEGLLNVDAYLTRQERFDLKAMERDLAKSLEQIRLTDMRRRLLKRVAQKGEWVVQNLPEQAMTQVSGGKTKTDMPAPTTKIVCCFDNRLSIAGSEWKDWLETDEGKAAFKEGMLETPKEGGRWVVEKMGIDGRLQVWQGLCLTRRCQRHTAWLKSGLRTADDTLKTHHDHISELEAEIRRLRMKGAKRKQGKGAGDGGDIAL